MGVDLADMQLISKCSRGIKYLLCVIDLFSAYAWIAPLKDKKGVTAECLSMYFRQSQKENQTKYGLIKTVNFVTVLLKNA